MWLHHRRGRLGLPGAHAVSPPRGHACDPVFRTVQGTARMQKALACRRARRSAGAALEILSLTGLIRAVFRLVDLVRCCRCCRLSLFLCFARQGPSCRCCRLVLPYVLLHKGLVAGMGAGVICYQHAGCDIRHGPTPPDYGRKPGPPKPPYPQLCAVV